MLHFSALVMAGRLFENKFMISPDVWRTNVRGVVRRLADEEFQRKAWLEPGPENVFSPDELICEFFDDLLFDEFLTSKEVSLNSQQRHAGEELQSELDLVSKATPVHLDPATTFHDPRWHEVRKLAAVFLQLL